MKMGSVLRLRARGRLSNSHYYMHQVSWFPLPSCQARVHVEQTTSEVPGLVIQWNHVESFLI